jgi:hypothetical protein
MLECEQSGTVTLGTAAEAPVKGSRATQGVVPLGEVTTPIQSPAFIQSEVATKAAPQTGLLEKLLGIRVEATIFAYCRLRGSLTTAVLRGSLYIQHLFVH